MIQLVLKLKKKKKKKTKTGQVRTRGVNWLRAECLCKFGCETIMSVKSFRAKYVAFFREPSPQTICVSFVIIWLVVTPNIYTKSFAMGNAKVSKPWRHVMLKHHERILHHSCVGIMTSWHDWHVHFRRCWPCARESYWSPVNSPRKGPVTRSFDVLFFNVSPNKLLNRHWGCWLVNKPWRSYDVALMV